MVDRAHGATPQDVDRALAAESPDLADFAALLSPAADGCLEELARRANRITLERFGKTVQLYAPLYVSNECVETCTYCSFSRENPIARKTLTPEEANAEARILLDRGFRHLLLVSGEHPRHVSPEYLETVLRSLAADVPSLSVEVQPQTAEVYERWVGAGAEGLVVYQETYDRDAYARVHLAGKKKNYDWRLDTPDRGAAAGMRRIGIGALFGLADWRLEAVHLALHARYLMKRYWTTSVSVSFPRLRPAAYALPGEHTVEDRDLARMVCAFRILLPDLGITLSTRESAAFRDGMIRLGVTQMSAGSRTEPGGYSEPSDAEEQFSVEDLRSAEEVSLAIRRAGYDPVWKDWEAALHG
ncbi:MAG: 2-iminoacetate synthase ThiH [Gemmatimonadetes bacterium]|nr:2-iminoacetate synthase ThiH [Gemmatimonadota bacterium]